MWLEFSDLPRYVLAREVQYSLCFHYSILLMLDLGFVRDNLPKIEEMLRNRGMNPDVMLKDFRVVDGQRRQAISSVETLKAHRNRLSQEVASAKKSGHDASELIAETKDMRVQIQEL